MNILKSMIIIIWSINTVLIAYYVLMSAFKPHYSLYSAVYPLLRGFY
jgi:hypothetical protein